ncbi:HIRAN domain-containing protein [Clostridium sp. ZBS20]|uniref:HIRAN domain-containing protein n=1 Tax=Clostridium sp. ZBS20 TaxID=2949966 RepID=UPI001E0CA50C|nr:HIRAN domain-containing protein [Clostridium sp. ZBS20]HBJ1646729.1 HIRAN domain-containing protein [Clostridium botulinum]
MAKKNGKDFIYLIWKEPKSRQQFVIAKLSKNGKYEFEYGFNIQQALDKGFIPFIAFNDIEKVYKNDKLFTSFSSRIPDRRRKDIKDILDMYGLEEYDEYELLKKSGGRLPIDDLEFIDPIVNNGENPIKRCFYVAGPRHYLGCKGEECVKAINVEVNENLKLELQPTNEYDKYAIKVCNEDENLIGYIPRYYSKELTDLINEGWKYTVKAYEINKNNNCNECLKITLKLEYN